MKQSRTFRRIIVRMPSKKFRWSVFGVGDEFIGAGFARSKQEARELSLDLQRRKLVEIQAGEKRLAQVNAHEGHTFRHQVKAGHAHRPMTRAA